MEDGIIEYLTAIFLLSVSIYMMSKLIKSIEKIKNRQTCTEKYSFYAQTRTISNCTKVENVYIKGRLVGRKYCVPF